MPKFEVKATVDFVGYVEAEDEQEAEQYGWKWESDLHYDGVFDIVVTELESDEDE